MAATFLRSPTKPVNPDASPGLVTAYQQAARALATKILSRV
jgi:hypothetical protein